MNTETVSVANRQNNVRARLDAAHLATRKANAAAIAALPFAITSHNNAAGLNLRAVVAGNYERIMFMGGKHGEHSLDLLVTDAARAWAHWHGYCAANGVTVPVAAPVAPVTTTAPKRSNRLSSVYVRRPLTRDEAPYTECFECGTSRYAGQMFWFADFGHFCTKRCADVHRREMDAAASE